ncbi:MAG: hypothetical protein F6K37_17465 [Moorea sp. SIO4E2]|nr:hypothetical protein [Moorena sp. SIO4E2]
MNKTQQSTTGELGEREYCRGAATPEKVEWASCPFPRVKELPLLTEKERHQLLVAWNDTATDYPKDKCIHQFKSCPGDFVGCRLGCYYLRNSRKPCQSNKTK